MNPRQRYSNQHVGSHPGLGFRARQSSIASIAISLPQCFSLCCSHGLYVFVVSQFEDHCFNSVNSVGLGKCGARMVHKNF